MTDHTDDLGRADGDEPLDDLTRVLKVAFLDDVQVAASARQRAIQAALAERDTLTHRDVVDLSSVRTRRWARSTLSIAAGLLLVVAGASVFVNRQGSSFDSAATESMVAEDSAELRVKGDLPAADAAGSSHESLDSAADEEVVSAQSEMMVADAAAPAIAEMSDVAEMEEAASEPTELLDVTSDDDLVSVARETQSSIQRGDVSPPAVDCVLVGGLVPVAVVGYFGQEVAVYVDDVASTVVAVTTADCAVVATVPFNK